MAEDERGAVVDAAGVTRVLRRVPAGSLAALLQDLPGLGRSEAARVDAAVARAAGKKTSLVAGAVRALKGRLTAEQAAAADLVAAAEGRRVRQWVAYEAEGVPDAAMAADPRAFAAALGEALGAFFRQRTDHAVRNGDVWVRALIGAGSQDVVFIVRFHRTPYVLVSRLGKRQAPFVRQALRRALACEAVREAGLEGHDAAGLRELLLHRGAQGAMRSMRRQEADENPLARRRKVPRRPARRPAPLGLLVREDAAEAGRRRKYADAVFGRRDAGPQPALPSARVSTTLPMALCAFHDGSAARRGDAPEALLDGTLIECEVALEGPSVLDGLRALVEQGMAVPPLPKVLEELPSAARSSFRMGGGDGRE